MSEDGYWIQQAIPESHKGRFHRWAARKGFLNQDGTIDLRAANAYLEKHPNKRLQKEENLAITLRRLRAER
jgi:hypothetical protein